MEQQQKQQQVKQKSASSTYNYRLDRLSWGCILEIQRMLQEHGQFFSQTVVVRRALRHYYVHLKGEGIDFEREITLAQRAAKGIQ